MNKSVILVFFICLTSYFVKPSMPLEEIEHRQRRHPIFQNTDGICFESEHEKGCCLPQRMSSMGISIFSDQTLKIKASWMQTMKTRLDACGGLAENHDDETISFEWEEDTLEKDRSLIYNLKGNSLSGQNWKYSLKISVPTENGCHVAVLKMDQSFYGASRDCHSYFWLKPDSLSIEGKNIEDQEFILSSP